MFSFTKKIPFETTKLDVLMVGEVLVDIISNQHVPSFKEADSFDRYFGGSPANIAINVSQLGANSALISKVGADGLGDFLLEKLNYYQVDTSGVIIDPNYNTSVVLVTQSKKSPQFLAYRGAEEKIFPQEVKDFQSLVEDSKIIHLSTFALSACKTRQALLEVVEFANQNDKLISLDPNYRSELWQGKTDGSKFITDLLTDIDIIKPSLDDAEALFGAGKPDEYIQKFHQAGASLVILTLGADGLIVSTGDTQKRLDSFAVDVVDTTGAGDAFWSGFYTSLVDGEQLKTAVEVGNATAALVLQQVGALTDLPVKDEIIAEFNLKKGGR